MKTAINIPVVAPEVVITVPNMDAGSVDHGRYNPGEQIVATATPGPAGSTWNDPEKDFYYRWSGSNLVDTQGSSSDTFVIGYVNGQSGSISVSASSEGVDGNVQTATGINYLKEDTSVQGAFTTVIKKIVEYLFYGLLIGSTGLILYLSIRKHNKLKYNLLKK